MPAPLPVILGAAAIRILKMAERAASKDAVFKAERLFGNKQAYRTEGKIRQGRYKLEEKYGKQIEKYENTPKRKELAKKKLPWSEKSPLRKQERLNRERIDKMKEDEAWRRMQESLDEGASYVEKGQLPPLRQQLETYARMMKFPHMRHIMMNIMKGNANFAVKKAVLAHSKLLEQTGPVGDVGQAALLMAALKMMQDQADKGTELSEQEGGEGREGGSMQMNTERFHELEQSLTRKGR